MEVEVLEKVGFREIQGFGSGPGFFPPLVIGGAEEQLLYDNSLAFYGGRTKGGQRLTISSRAVTKLAFVLRKTGSPTGNVTFGIRKVSDNSLVAEKVLGDASALTSSSVWYEVTLDTPVAISEEVRIYVEHNTGTGSNYIIARFKDEDVKASEYLSSYGWPTSGDWYGYTSFDMAYKYTWE